MKFSDRHLEKTKIPRNPILESVDLTKPELELGEIGSLPRHLTYSRSKAVLTAREGSETENNLKPYSDTDSLNLCPTLNFYQKTDNQNEIAQLHLENIRQNLEKRIQSAKSSGNHHLAQTLEQEFRELAPKQVCC